MPVTIGYSYESTKGYDDPEHERLHRDTVAAGKRLSAINGSLEDLAKVQEFAPMFKTALDHLAQLKVGAKVEYDALKHEYAERVLRPLSIEALPETRYPFLYARSKVMVLDPTTGAQDYKASCQYADEKLKHVPADTISELDSRWRMREEQPVRITLLHDEDFHTLHLYYKWLVYRMDDRLKRKAKSDERKARKKAYDAWAKQVKKDTGEELPKFGSREASNYFYGSGFREPAGDTKLPEGIDFK